jgi:protoporphyrinogen oxidase
MSSTSNVDTDSTPARRPHIAVIGAGPMGLAAAYELCKTGASVEIFERDHRVGGMSAHFDFGGTPIERYYHFVCAPDATTFHYLKELGLASHLRWTETHMGFYYDGRLFDWGNPKALLSFPGLSLLQKVRYGLHVMRTKLIDDWRPYDRMSSTEWLQAWIGKSAYDVLWRPLFQYKFYEHQDALSAAWLGTRIKRVALSRKSILQERLGYIQGGSELLLGAVAREIERLGGHLHLNARVEKVLVDSNLGSQCVRGLSVGGQERSFDAVVSTVPLPYVSDLVPDLPAEEAGKIAAIRNVGVVCVILKLKRPFSRNFWMNINDPRIEIPGLIEYTNLNPLDGNTIVYAPFYMPQTHPKYGRPFGVFIEETLQAMEMIRPDFDRSDMIEATASRYHFSQPVFSPGFFDALPPMKSALRGLFLADTAHCYPEDRSISESMRIGAELARLARA